jgi:hypothetical protein
MREFSQREYASCREQYERQGGTEPARDVHLTLIARKRTLFRFREAAAGLALTVVPGILAIATFAIDVTRST